MILRRFAALIVVLLCQLLVGCSSSDSELLGTWTAVSASPEPLVLSAAITIKFDGVSVTGSGGCNGYGASSATVSNGKLVVDGTVSTSLACQEPGLMEQEGRFQELLGSQPKVQVEGDTLVLTGAKTTMTFNRTTTLNKS